MGLSATLNVFKGVQVGHLLNEGHRSEVSVRQGRENPYLTGSFQASMVNAATIQVSRVFDAAGVVNPLPGPAKSLLRITGTVAPIAIGFLTKNVKNPLLSKVINVIHDNVGNICILAGVVSTVALAVLGQFVVAGATFTFLAIGVLDQTGVFPESVRQVIHFSGFWITTATGIIVGDPLTKVIAVVELVCWIADKIIDVKFKKNHHVEPYDKVKPTNLSIQDVSTLSVDPEDYEIQKGHLNIDTVPADPNVSYDLLFQMMEKIDWKQQQNYAVISSILASDSRWQDYHKNDHGNKEKEIAYLKDQLKKLVDRVSNHKILEGEPNNYKLLETYFKHVIFLAFDSPEKTQADVLTRLGIQGGEYCGTGAVHQIEKLYQELALNGKKLPLTTKIYMLLENERYQKFQQVYHWMWKGNSFNAKMSKLVNPIDIHTFNLYAKLFHDEFGLRDQALKNDDSSVITPFTKVAFNMLSSVFKKMFWKGGVYQSTEGLFVFEGYKPETIVDALSLHIGTPVIAKSDVYQWWNEWLKKQPDSPEKQAFQDSLYNGGLEEKGMVQRRYLIAMSLELGVLKKK